MGRYPCFGLCARERTRPTFCSSGVQCTTLVSTGVEPVILASARPTDHRRTGKMMKTCLLAFAYVSPVDTLTMPSLWREFSCDRFRSMALQGVEPCYRVKACTQEVTQAGHSSVCSLAPCGPAYVRVHRLQHQTRVRC